MPLGGGVAADRGLRSAGSLLAFSMSSGLDSIERSGRTNSRSIPRTNSRVRLPLDDALSELSRSLEDASFQMTRPSSVDPSQWHASVATPNVRRPWTSGGLTGQGSHAATGRVAATGIRGRLSDEEQSLESLLAQKHSSLEREGISRASLKRAGLGPRQASRLYRVIYLHSCGLQDVLLSLTDACGVAERGEVLLSVWKVFVWLVEYLMADKASTDFSLALQQSSDTMAMLSERYEEEAVRCDELSESLGSVATRTAELENEVYGLRESLDKTQRDAMAVSSAKDRTHQQVIQQAEAMLQEGDIYSRKLYTTLEQERNARMELRSALETAHDTIRQKEQKLERSRHTVQQAELASRSAVAERSKVNAQLLRTQQTLGQAESNLAAERESVRSVTAQLKKQTEDNTALGQKCDHVTSALQGLRTQHTKSTQLCDRFKERLAAEKVRNGRIMQQLELAKGTINMEVQKRQAAEVKCVNLGEQLSTVGGRLAETAEQRDAAVATRQALEADLERSTEELKAAKLSALRCREELDRLVGSNSPVTRSPPV